MEKNTKYFLGLEKARSNAKVMDRLVDSNGRVITNQSEILTEQVRFYSEVYRKKKDFDVANANDFVRNLDIPKLSEEDKTKLDNDITVEEIAKSLRSMSNDSSPGPDGITYSFLKFFWTKISDMIYNSFNSAFATGEMSYTQRQGILTLIHKGKELQRDNLSNWRPISLTNTDYKVLAKLLANRLTTVITSIISPDQVGFIKGRNISTIIRLVDDTIDLLNSSGKSGAILAVDYRRAFDSISQEYTLWAFKKFGFGDNFMKWVGVLFNNIESSINYQGWISESFRVDSGVRQGCPFSPLAFILGLEILAIKIRSNEGINGIILPTPNMNANITLALKIALYADDITLFLNNKNDMEKSIAIIKSFSVFSLLEINENKSELMKIGNVDEQDWGGNIRVTEKLKILGIYFKNNTSASLIEENWVNRIKKIENLIALWTKRNLSITGKICIIKTFLLSQLVYIIQALSIPEHILNKINTIIFRFLWKKKNTNTRAFEKIKRSTICNGFEYGGLTMINIVDMQKSFQISWITKLLEGGFDTVNIIPTYIFSKLGPNFISLKGTATIKSFIGLDKIKSHFWGNAMKVWIENREHLKIMTDNSILKYRKEILWNNELIKYRGKCLYFEEWARKGIHYISDLKNNNHIITFDEVCRLIGNSASRIFEYNAIYTALLSHNARNIPYLNTKDFYLKKSPTPKQIRNSLTVRNIQPNITTYWERRFNFIFSENIWIVARISTTEERLRLLQWKIIHRIYPTNILLHKMGIRNSMLCQDCNVIDSLEHFFFSCSKIRKIWELCQNFIFSSISKHIILTENDVIFGYRIDFLKSQEVRFINHLILITKMVISKFRYGESYDINYMFDNDVAIRKKYLLNVNV